MTFLSVKFPFKKFQFHQSAVRYIARAAVKLLASFGKRESPLFFQHFHLRETFYEILKLLCFGHHNTFRSLIEAPIRSVNVEKLQKFILPKYGHQY